MAHDPASANLVRGYAYSIMFMLSMPPLIFGSLCAYFYWEVRKAKAAGNKNRLRSKSGCHSAIVTITGRGTPKGAFP